MASARPPLDLIENFPSFDKARPLLEKIILDHGYRSIADVGGGANPMLGADFLATHGLRYCLIDRSPSELAKADAHCEKIEADACADTGAFLQQIGDRRFDLIFSHMLLEHLRDTRQAHINFFHALNPGGRCVHLYPSPNNLPLALNRLLPETVARTLIKFAQPLRDLEGSQQKFAAYYRMCGAPRPALTTAFEEMGYTVETHVGFIGHTYYERFPPLAALETRARRVIHRLGLPLTSGCLLVLRRPTNGP